MICEPGDTIYVNVVVACSSLLAIFRVFAQQWAINRYINGFVTKAGIQLCDEKQAQCIGHGIWGWPP